LTKEEEKYTKIEAEANPLIEEKEALEK